MIEVAPNLFVGSGADLADVLDAGGNVKDGWYVITAAKDPWHRQALGYTGRGAPKDHPEYLYAHRPNRLILNLVDTADPAYVSDALIEVALGEITQMIGTKKILIHCNEGKSRAPTIAMLWDVGNELRRHPKIRPDRPPAESAALIMAEFKALHYPAYAPAEGMRLYAQQWLEKMLTAA